MKTSKRLFIIGKYTSPKIFKNIVHKTKILNKMHENSHDIEKCNNTKTT